MLSTHYEITVRGRLGAALIGAFDGLTAAPSGADTVISGPIVDQAALYGVLARVESLGLELLDVRARRPPVAGARPSPSLLGGSPVSSLLHRVAVFSARRRLLVIGVWLVVLVGLGLASHAAGTQYSSSAEVAGSDSAAANDVMARSFSPELSDASPLVFHADSGSLKDDANAGRGRGVAEGGRGGGERRERRRADLLQGRQDRLCAGAAGQGAGRDVGR